MKKKFYNQPEVDVTAVGPMMLMYDASLLGGSGTGGEHIHAD